MANSFFTPCAHNWLTHRRFSIDRAEHTRAFDRAETVLLIVVPLYQAPRHRKRMDFWDVFFCPSYLVSSPFLFSLPPSRNSDPGHIAGSSPSPLPTTVRAFHFHREKTSGLYSLVGSCRIGCMSLTRHTAVRTVRFIRCCTLLLTLLH